MEITEVRVSLREHTDKRLKAYVTLTFDESFVVRNIKIIEGKNGLFVAMPSRKPKVTCGKCGFKADLGSRFCARCGASVERFEGPSGIGEHEPAEAAAHRDIAHPVTAEFRQYLQEKVLEAYEAERSRAGSAAAPFAGFGTGEPQAV